MRKDKDFQGHAQHWLGRGGREAVVAVMTLVLSIRGCGPHGLRGGPLSRLIRSDHHWRQWPGLLGKSTESLLRVTRSAVLNWAPWRTQSAHQKENVAFNQLRPKTVAVRVFKISNIILFQIISTHNHHSTPLLSWRQNVWAQTAIKRAKYTTNQINF